MKSDHDRDEQVRDRAVTGSQTAGGGAVIVPHVMSIAEMSSVLARLQSEAETLRTVALRADLRATLLFISLKEMLEMHGNPMDHAWLNASADERARRVIERARAAILVAEEGNDE